MAKTAILSVRILADSIGAAKGFNDTEKSAGKLERALGFMGKSVLAIGAAAGAAAVGTATGLYKIGSTWAGVTDNIRAGTGATGEALEGLIGEARAVGRAVPAEWDKVGSTVADLNTRLGLSGETLQNVSKQYLEAGRILGEDIDINQTAAAFKAFRLEGEQVEGAMDTLFRASQATGVGMNELAAGVQKAGPALTNLGFSFADSVALMGSLDKAGLNSQQVAASLTRSLTSLAKSGEQPADAFRRIIGELEGYVETGDTAKALELSSTIFGTRGASQFVHAIQSGVLNLENLTAAAGVSEDTIMGVAGETMHAAEHWQVLKNNAFAALEPLGSAVFSTVGDALGVISKAVQDVDFSFITDAAGDLKNLLAPILSQVAPMIGDLVPQVIELATSFSPLKLILEALQPVIPAVIDILGTLGQIIGEKVMPVVQEIIAAVLPVIQEIIAAVMPAFISVLEAIIPVLGAVIDAVLPVVSTLVDILKPAIEALGPVVAAIFNGAAAIVKGAMSVIRGVIDIVMGIITGNWGRVWTGIKSVLSGIWTAISGIVSGAIRAVLGVIRGVLGTIRAAWSAAWTGIKTFVSNTWNGIKNSVSSSLSNVVSTMSGLPGRVIRALGNIGSTLYNSGADLIRGMINGIGSMGRALYNKAKNIVKGAVDGVLSFLGIRSPSRLFAQIGVNTGQGLIQGLDNMRSRVLGSMTDLVQPPDVPDIPLPGTYRAAYAGGRPGTVQPPIQITVNGALDPVAVARQITELLRRYGHLMGGV